MGKKVIIIIAAILLIDQIIKVCVKMYMVPLDSGAIPVIDGFFQLYYIENKGMAFGATLGEGAWPKYALSIFRLGAIIGIAWYIRKLIIENSSPKGLIIAVALVFAGAAGNLIDSLCYDLIWSVDPLPWNYARDASNQVIYDTTTGAVQLRPHGFLLGSVVDMFQFTTVWPTWMPIIDLNLPSWLGGGNLIDIRPGKEIFGAIWNLADLSISIGVGLIIVRYRKFFRKHPNKTDEPAESDLPKMDSEESVVAPIDLEKSASSAPASS